MVGGKLLQQLLMVAAGAGVDELADLRRQIFPDAGDAEPFRRGEGGDALREVRDRLRGVAVRADLERVLALDFEQIADLGEDAGDGEVVHRSLPCGRGLADLDLQPVALDPEIEDAARRRPRARGASRGPSRGSPMQNRQPPPPAPQTLPP